MSETDTLSWGPSARKEIPHEYKPGTGGYCTECGWREDAYAHASEEERQVFDQQQRAAGIKARRDTALSSLRGYGITVDPGSNWSVGELEAMVAFVKDLAD